MRDAAAIDDNSIDAAKARSKYEITEMYFLGSVFIGSFIIISVNRFLPLPFVWLHTSALQMLWLGGMSIYWMRKRGIGYGYFRYSSRPYILGILQVLSILIIFSMRFAGPPPKDVGYPFFMNAMYVVSSIILWPVLEEIFYRGLLFEHLKRNLGVILAILITSIFFMVQHVPNQGWVLHHFYFSIVACLGYLAFKNLIFSITIHTMMNAYYIIFEMPGMTQFAVFLAMGFIIILMIIGLARGKHPYDIEDRQVPKSTVP